MTRTDFQQLANLRIDEAGVLLSNGKWPGAYYLAGYAVECALKACVAKLTKADDFPPSAEVIKTRYYVHDLNKLLTTAGLDGLRDAEAKVNSQFNLFWTLVVKWSEQARYERKSQAEAKALYNAVTDPTDGVLRWVQGHW